MHRDAGTADAAENRTARRTRGIDAARALTLCAVAVSLLLVPGGLTYYFSVRGPPVGDGPTALAVGVVALLPGVLMGAAGLWVAAHD